MGEKEKKRGVGAITQIIIKTSFRQYGVFSEKRVHLYCFRFHDYFYSDRVGLCARYARSHTPSESGVIHHQQVNRRRKASISLKAKVFLK